MHKESKSTIVVSAVPHELRERLEAMAAQNLGSMASEMRRALAEHVKRADEEDE